MTLLYLECDFIVFLDLVQVAFYVSENTFLRCGLLDKPKSFGFIEKRDDAGSIDINFLCRLPFWDANFDMFSVDSFLFCNVRGSGGDIPVFVNIGQHAIQAAIGSMGLSFFLSLSLLFLLFLSFFLFFFFVPGFLRFWHTLGVVGLLVGFPRQS